METTDLVPVVERDGIPTVNARELHAYLEVGKDFSNWIKDRVEKYGFQDGVDYALEVFANPGEKGGRPSKEYYISIDMAKELAMVENNEKGRQARRYFIEVEKRFRTEHKPLSGDALIAAALIEAKTVLDRQAKQIEAMKPAAQFYADVTGSRSAIEMSQVAKIIGMGYGRNSLFQLLRQHNVLRQNNEPYQKFIDAGWFRVIEQKWQDDKGETHINIKTLVYQRGIEGIIDLIRKISS